MRALLDRIDAVSNLTMIAWLTAVTLALHAEQVCDWWGRMMEKRAARADELPAKSPDARSEALASGKVLPLMRNPQVCVRMATSSVRIRAMRPTPVLDMRRARALRGRS